jgi:MFS family permease
LTQKVINWRGIVALNAVSTLSQLGQFGIGFVVLPIWLAARGLGAIELGLFGSAGWTGMLAALLITPKLIAQFGSKKVVLASLLLSSVGFLMMPYVHWPLWMLSSALIGFGLGLRWIANETWLYRIVPKDILGQVVGVHEALISLAVIIPPALVAVFSTADNILIWIGIMFNVFPVIPLMMIT